ncbi:MAG: hypothetical protein KDD11_03755 [Acidobacteria bacterium]|nr:hypothetical protein [Acidobacteriota bacterium]
MTIRNARAPWWGLAGALAVLVTLATVASPKRTAPETTSEVRPFLRGMTITCPRGGEIWGTETMREALRDVKALGVDSVAIHPYARIERDGTVRFRPTADSPFLGRAVEMARQEGISLFWKPHLAYWGNFVWRGEITFERDEDWQRFFRDYRAFILDQAAFAGRAGVPIFAVGVELEGTTSHEAEWRSLIAEIRRVFPGRLTYAANWDRVDAVPFWDALDLVGVQAYFPLSDADGPDETALGAGWARELDRLGALSHRLGDKPVVFTEIGYNRSPVAARTPWDYRVEDNPATRALRTRLLDVAITRAEAAPFVAGMYWWKWMPGHSFERSNFSMRDTEAREVLERRWAGHGR